MLDISAHLLPRMVASPGERMTGVPAPCRRATSETDVNVAITGDPSPLRKVVDYVQFICPMERTT